MRTSWAVLVWLFLGAPLLAQDVPLEVKGDTIVVVQKLPFTVNAPEGYDQYFWSYPGGVNALDKGKVLEVMAAPNGKVTIGIKTLRLNIDWDKKTYKFEQKFGTVVFMVGSGPTPPDPPNPPVPPNPDLPFPGAGVRALIIYESADLTRMPAAQQAVIYGKTARDALNAKCVLGKDGKTRDWRMWDKDADPSAEGEMWIKAMRRPRQSVPWIIISNGSTAFEGPLPATVADFTTLLNKF